MLMLIMGMCSYEIVTVVCCRCSVTAVSGRTRVSVLNRRPSTSCTAADWIVRVTVTRTSTQSWELVGNIALSVVRQLLCYSGVLPLYAMTATAAHLATALLHRRPCDRQTRGRQHVVERRRRRWRDCIHNRRRRWVPRVQHHCTSQCQTHRARPAALTTWRHWLRSSLAVPRSGYATVSASLWRHASHDRRQWRHWGRKWQVQPDSYLMNDCLLGLCGYANFCYPTRAVPALRYLYPIRTRATVPVLIPAGNITLVVFCNW